MTMTEPERNALLKTFPPCDCGSVDKYGDDLGEHSPSCPYHLAAVAAVGVTVDAPGEPTADLRVEPSDLKMLRETLCMAQTALQTSPTTIAQGHTASHVVRLGRLIAEIDRHRPLAPDGKHGDLHTPTCGCGEPAVGTVEVIHCDECGAWGGGVEVHLVTCSKREEVAKPVDDWQRGHWMQTITGRAFYPMSPRVEDIDPTDIAHALGMQCRYNGHVKRFYSVAEHCALMSDWALANLGETDQEARRFALAALLHDATEAYIGDMVRPLKLHMPAFRAIDDELVALVYRRFGLVFDTVPTEVTVIDARILLDEREVLLTAPPQSWGLGDLQPLGVKVKCWAPETAKWEYLARLRELTGVEA